MGVLGGMIGLGGAEFRLPLLIGLFGFIALQAVILNKAMSLIVVITALPARLASVPYADLAPHWSIVVNLLGAWAGATWATKMRSATLYKTLAMLLVLIAIALSVSHFGHLGSLQLESVTRTIAGVIAGFGIGVVAALMGGPAASCSSQRSCCSTRRTSRSPEVCLWRCRYQQCWWRSLVTVVIRASVCCARTGGSWWL